MSEAKIWAAGIPTEPDVAKVRDEIGVPAEGTFLPWERFEQILRLPRANHRLKTILYRWRQQLEKSHNLLLKPVPGKGYEVMNPEQVAHFLGDKLAIHNRGIGRVHRRSERVDRNRLTPEGNRIIDHVNRSSAAMRLANATTAKSLPPITTNTK